MVDDHEVLFSLIIIIIIILYMISQHFYHSICYHSGLVDCIISISFFASFLAPSFNLIKIKMFLLLPFFFSDHNLTSCQIGPSYNENEPSREKTVD